LKERIAFMDTPKKRQISKPPTQKQIDQRNLRLALGAVTGFHGWLTGLENHVRKTPIDAISKYFLEKDVMAFRNRLKITEEKIRRKLKNL
jgi:hypothetical protein